MTIGTRRQLLVLGALVIVAVGVTVWRSPGGNRTGGGAVGASDGSPAARVEEGVTDVHLESLQRAASSNAQTQRNVFRFESRQSAAPRPAQLTAPPVDAAVAAPTGPAPPPPIPLRYIGYVDQAGEEMPRVAVLSDGRGNVFNGKEGDIIEGRYRVLRVGTDSADLVYVDGRGRQTIRLSGQ